MQRKNGWLSAVILASIGPLTASAAESGLYFGAGLGQARYDVKQSEFDGVFEDALASVGITVLDGDSDLDKNDTSIAAFMGYKLNPNFALEAGYQDLGKADYNADATVFLSGVGSGPLSGGASIESDGMTLSALGIWPVSEAIDLYARAGVFFSKTKLKVSLATESDSVSGKDEDFYFGLGGGWNITENWALRLEWQQFKKVGKKSETGEGDVDVVNLGVVFRL